MIGVFRTLQQKISYIPVNLLLIAVCCTFVFGMINHFVDKQAAQSHYSSVQHNILALQTSLKNIERQMINRIIQSRPIYDFFENRQPHSKLVHYFASQEIHRLMQSDPLIHSVYLYRDKDQTVLTSGYMKQLEQFPDKDFIEKMKHQSQSVNWTPKRDYTEYVWLESEVDVVSMTKNAQLYYSSSGFVVLNVKVDALLKKLAANIDQADGGQLHIWDRDGRLIYTTNTTADTAHPDTNSEVQISSDYLGWYIAIGGPTSSPVKSILIPVQAGVIAVLLTAAFFYHLKLRKLTLERSDKELNVLKKQFFLEWLEDEREESDQESQTYLTQFGLQGKLHRLVIAVIEIDKYLYHLQEDRQKMYKSKEAMNKAVDNWGLPDSEALWKEWISRDRMAIMVHFPQAQGGASQEQEASYALETLASFRESIADELMFTVTIGMGCITTSMSGLKRSYREAMSALEYKMSVGSDRILEYAFTSGQDTGVNTPFFRWMEQLVHQFRAADPDWEAVLNRSFEHLQDLLLKSEEIHRLLHYLIHRFAREIGDMSVDLQQYWHRELQPELTKAIKKLDTIPDLHTYYLLRLRAFYETYTNMLADRDPNRQLVYDIRAFIEEHYANPDLSLNLISDQFDINGKYASQLFKEEFGIKFVDFLIGLRIEHAKRMLLETEMPINEISRQVGYQHSMSFGRIFKRLVGVTPIDYRKYNQA